MEVLFAWCTVSKYDGRIVQQYSRITAFVKKAQERLHYPNAEKADTIQVSRRFIVHHIS